MTDRDVLEEFARIMGGTIHGPYVYGAPGRKPMFNWRVQTWQDVERVIAPLYPYLHSRRKAQVDAVLAEKPDNLRVRRKWARVPVGECPPEPIASQVGYARHKKAGTEPCAVCVESIRLYGRLRAEELCERQGRKYVPRPWRMETLERKGRKVA